MIQGVQLQPNCALRNDDVATWPAERALTAGHGVDLSKAEVVMKAMNSVKSKDITRHS